MYSFLESEDPKNGIYNILDNYIDDDLEKYHNKDCVYILHIKDDIYKYGNSSHLAKRLQAHKTNFNYEKIIKIYESDNMNSSKKLENKIKNLTKTLNINIIYGNHIEFFQIVDSNLKNIIDQITEFALEISYNDKFKNNHNLEIEKEKTRQLELQIELLKLK